VSGRAARAAFSLHRGDFRRQPVASRSNPIRHDPTQSYHRDHGWLDGKGEPRPSAHLERLLRAEIADHCDALGMSPRSRARLGLDLQRGYDLAQAMSDPDPEERRRLMVDAGIEEDDA
jgi:hypothetical protein